MCEITSSGISCAASGILSFTKAAAIALRILFGSLPLSFFKIGSFPSAPIACAGLPPKMLPSVLRPSNSNGICAPEFSAPACHASPADKPLLLNSLVVPPAMSAIVKSVPARGLSAYMAALAARLGAFSTTPPAIFIQYGIWFSSTSDSQSSGSACAMLCKPLLASQRVLFTCCRTSRLASSIATFAAILPPLPPSASQRLLSSPCWSLPMSS